MHNLSLAGTTIGATGYSLCIRLGPQAGIPPLLQMRQCETGHAAHLILVVAGRTMSAMHVIHLALVPETVMSVRAITGTHMWMAHLITAGGNIDSQAGVIGDIYRHCS